MGFSLPSPGRMGLPEVPSALAQKDPVLYDYLQKQRTLLEEFAQRMFENDKSLANILDTGTAGTFVVGTSTISVSYGAVTGIS